MITWATAGALINVPGPTLKAGARCQLFTRVLSRVYPSLNFVSFKKSKVPKRNHEHKKEGLVGTSALKKHISELNYRLVS